LKTIKFQETKIIISGKLYIDFRGEERSIESFGKLIYRIYKFEELENIGSKLDLESKGE
jgi:hypothetical protein